MTNLPVQRQMIYSLTSSHLCILLKISGSFFCTHLYFHRGSFTLVEAARVLIRLLSSMKTFTPDTVMPWVWHSANSFPAR